MKAFVLIALTLCGPIWASGQIVLGLKLQQPSTLQFESVVATLEIKNNGVLPLVVARDVEPVPQLEFRVLLRESKKIIERRKEGNLLANVYLLAGQTHKMNVRLSDWYDLSEMGHYDIQAVLRWNDDAFGSHRRILEVVRGLELARTEFFLPDAPRDGLIGALRYWRRDDTEHLFLCVTDREGRVSYGSFSLGPVLRITRPRIEAEPGGILRTMHRSGGDCYSHFKLRVGATGTQLLEERYATALGHPCGPSRKASAEKAP